jgi:hypothetical protein
LRIIFEGETAEQHWRQRTEPESTPGYRHGVGDHFTALGRQRLIADQFILQLVTFLRALHLSLELIVPGSANPHSQSGSDCGKKAR